MNYNFDWNVSKEQANRKKHGVTFEEAATIFHDPRAMTIFDPDHGNAEDRWITLGISSSGRLLIVCHTFIEIDRHSADIRIFSSR